MLKSEPPLEKSFGLFAQHGVHHLKPRHPSLAYSRMPKNSWCHSWHTFTMPSLFASVTVESAIIECINFASEIMSVKDVEWNWEHHKAYFLLWAMGSFSHNPGPGWPKPENPSMAPIPWPKIRWLQCNFCSFCVVSCVGFCPAFFLSFIKWGILFRVSLQHFSELSQFFT